MLTNEERKILVGLLYYIKFDSPEIRRLKEKLEQECILIIEQDDCSKKVEEVHVVVGGASARARKIRELVTAILKEGEGATPSQTVIDSWVDEGLNNLCDGRVTFTEYKVWEKIKR